MVEGLNLAGRLYRLTVWLERESRIPDPKCWAESQTDPLGLFSLSLPAQPPHPNPMPWNDFLLLPGHRALYPNMGEVLFLVYF